MNKQLNGGLPIKTGHLFMIGAIIMALLTAVLFTNVIGKQKATTKTPAVETQKVIVAAEFIPAGTELSSKHLSKVDWPAKYIAKGSAFSTTHDLIGKMPRADVYPGEIIYRQKLLGDTSRGGLESIIPAGMRAISISVNEVRSVSGFVKPGDHVDVMATIQTEGNEEVRRGFSTKTVLQNVLVLAVAQNMVDDRKPDIDTPEGVKEGTVGKEDEDTGKGKKKKEDKKDSKKTAISKTVTLALTPDEAESVALAEEAAELHLSLRRPDDASTNLATGTTVGKLMSGASFVMSNGPAVNMPPFPTPAPVSSGPGVELIQGTEKTIVDFNHSPL